MIGRSGTIKTGNWKTGDRVVGCSGGTGEDRRRSEGWMQWVGVLCTVLQCKNQSDFDNWLCDQNVEIKDVYHQCRSEVECEYC